MSEDLAALSFLTNFNAGFPSGVPVQPVDLSARVASLEAKNAELEERVKRTEMVNEKLLLAFQKLAMTLSQTAILPQTSILPKSMTLPQSVALPPPNPPGHGFPSFSSPAASQGLFSSTPGPASTSLSVVVVKTETPGLTSPTSKSESSKSKDPATMTRAQLMSAISGKKFDPALESFLNSIKTELKPSDKGSSGPLKTAQTMYGFAKEDISALVPMGESAFLYGCKYVMSINHFLKKFNKTEEGELITIPDEDGDDDSLMTDLDMIPTAPVPQQSVEEDTGPSAKKQKVVDWKDLSFQAMQIQESPLDFDLGGASKMGKETALSDSEALGLLFCFARLGDFGMHPFMKSSKVMFIRFACVFELTISYSEVASRLLKILVAICLHEAVRTSDMSFLSFVMLALPGVTLDTKLVHLLTVAPLKKDLAPLIHELFNRACGVLRERHGCNTSAQATSTVAIQQHITKFLQAPTRCNPVEQLLHVLILATFFKDLQDLEQGADLLLDAVRKAESSDLVAKLCPDGKIAAYACSKHLTF